MKNQANQETVRKQAWSPTKDMRDSENGTLGKTTALNSLSTSVS